VATSRFSERAVSVRHARPVTEYPSRAEP